MEVPHLLPRQKALDGGVHVAVGDPLPGHDPAVGAAGFEGEWQVAELRGEAFGSIARAGVLMDEDRAGGRIAVQARERVVGEEDAVLLALAELLEAEAAGAVAGRPLDV